MSHVTIRSVILMSPRCRRVMLSIYGFSPLIACHAVSLATLFASGSAEVDYGAADTPLFFYFDALRYHSLADDAATPPRLRFADTPWFDTIFCYAGVYCC